jgi:hypothetical protein
MNTVISVYIKIANAELIEPAQHNFITCHNILLPTSLLQISSFRLVYDQTTVFGVAHIFIIKK